MQLSTMDVFEVAHQMDLLPILAVFYLGRRRLAEPVAWLLACAWLVSWFGSSLQHFSGGEWWTSYLWLPVQFALAFMAFGLVPIVAVAVAVTLGALSALVSAPGPDVFMSVTCSALLVAMLLMERGPYVLPAALYFGLGTVCYVLMVERTGESIMPAWYAYQGSRALAYLAFLAVVIRRRKSWATR